MAESRGSDCCPSIHFGCQEELGLSKQELELWMGNNVYKTHKMYKATFKLSKQKGIWGTVLLHCLLLQCKR